MRTIAADPKHLGAEIGVTAVLHTWGQNLDHHPHVHCVVPGGGVSLDGERWIVCKPGFFLPVKALARLFRRLFLAALEAAFDKGELRFFGELAPLCEPRAFAKHIVALRKMDWIVYAKPPFGRPEQVFRYLGRYTHRVGLSNYRLVMVDEHRATFRTRGDTTVTVSPEQFIGRSLLHVLPKGFVKIRHHGLMAPSNVGTKLAQARRLLEAAGPPAPPAPPADSQGSPADFFAIVLALAARAADPQRPCPRCGVGTMFRFTFAFGRGDVDLPPQPEPGRLDSS